MADTEKWRDRKMRLLLYPEDPSHVKAMEILESGWSYASILHDKDTWEESDPDLGDHTPGSPKKPHWHVVVRFGQARWANAVAKELGIAENYVRPCTSIDGALLYLVHFGSESKYQYDLSEVQGLLAKKLAALLEDQEDEGSRILQIVYLIDESPGKASYREILTKCCKAGLWSQFRKLGSGVKYLIDEHNEDLGENTQKGGFPDWDRLAKKTAGMGWVERCDRLDKKGVKPGEI